MILNFVRETWSMTCVTAHVKLHLRVLGEINPATHNIAAHQTMIYFERINCCSIKILFRDAVFKHTRHLQSVSEFRKKDNENGPIQFISTLPRRLTRRVTGQRWPEKVAPRVYLLISIGPSRRAKKLETQPKNKMR